MGRGRMKEIEAWHQFLQTLSSWLALHDEAFVNELTVEGHGLVGKNLSSGGPKKRT